MYQNYIDENKSEVVSAYVMFRSMEGKERAIKAFSHGFLARTLLSCLCCRHIRYQQKKLLGRWLKVKTAPAPDIILWENLKVGKCTRCLRILVTSLVTIVIVAVTFAVVLLAKDFQNQAESYSPSVECPLSEVT